MMATLLEIWHSKRILVTCWNKSVLIHKNDIIRKVASLCPTVLMSTHEFFQNILRTYDMSGSTVALNLISLKVNSVRNTDFLFRYIQINVLPSLSFK